MKRCGKCAVRLKSIVCNIGIGARPLGALGSGLASRDECHAVSLQAFGAALPTYNDAVFLQICSKQRYESGRLKRHKWALEYLGARAG